LPRRVIFSKTSIQELLVSAPEIHLALWFVWRVVTLVLRASDTNEGPRFNRKEDKAVKRKFLALLTASLVVAMMVAATPASASTHHHHVHHQPSMMNMMNMVM
jgi:hypothetical protein